MSAYDPHNLSLVACHRLLAWFNDCLVTALGLRGVLPNVESQEVEPGLSLLGFQGMGDTGLARFQFQSHAAPLFRQQHLTALDHGPLGMEDDQ
jgi:hypothetical protein